MRKADGIRSACLTALALALAGCPRPDPCAPDPCGWTQWGLNASHDGASCATAQPLQALLADVLIDPMVKEEEADDSEASIVIHYQAPLVQCDDVFVEEKWGRWKPCRPPQSGLPVPCGWQARELQTWREARYRWENGALVPRWAFDSDWKPPPWPYFEPVFQPALAGGFLYVPGSGGKSYRLDRESGAVLQRFDPVGSSTAYGGPITADGTGRILYTTVDEVSGAGWLVAIAPDGTVTRVGFGSLVPGAPRAEELCTQAFPSPATSPSQVPPSAPCGPQRPAVNAAPAIGPDGTIFVVSRAHHASRYTYLVAVNPDLTPKWSASLRGRLTDGTPPGTDPFTNQPPAGAANDDSSSSPVALPDGAVIYGALTDYDTGRGHLMKFNADGSYGGAYPFGWDVTPAVRIHDGTYSIILKDNHYDAVSGYFIVELDPSLGVVRKIPSTNTKSCSRVGGQIQCNDDHPGGFEWCTNAPALDAAGNVLVTSEDGNLYSLPADGGTPSSYLLEMALGAAYTPTTIDSAGRVYAINGGHLEVLGGR